MGVDGGGTKTQVFLTDTDQQRGITSVGNASNPNSVGWDVAVNTVEALIDSCLQVAGKTKSDVAALSLCMAGIDRPEQIRTMQDQMSPRFPNAQVEVTNDALAALSAGTGGESGVVLIAGTGSIAVGESTSGKIARAGGYGSLIGDEGSGFAIGRDGLMAAIQSCEGRGDKTELWERAKAWFQLTDPSDLILKVYGASHPVGTVASFARQVVEAASSDAIAKRIIAKAMDDYVLLVQSVREQLNDAVSNKVILNGGLFTNTDVLAEELQTRLHDLQCIVLQVSAAAGAALRAMTLQEKDVRCSSLPSEKTKVWTDVAHRFEWC